MAARGGHEKGRFLAFRFHRRCEVEAEEGPTYRILNETIWHLDNTLLQACGELRY